MELHEISADELFGLFDRTVTPYGGRAFNMLNSHRAEALRAFALFDGKNTPRLGILFGLRDGEWRLPFSAPFGEVLYRKEQHFETCLEFSRALAAEGLPMRITLAPDIYDPVMLPRIKGAFAAVARDGFSDYNYSYPLDRYASFSDGLSATARQKYRRSKGAGFEFHAYARPEEVYEVIRRNRSERGYPLAMSFQDLLSTASVGVEIDWHLLTLGTESVAAAVVYRLNPRVAQVIYWGDVAGFSSDRPMNLLAAEVTDLYKNLGFSVLDIGPSSSAGVPDVGLCTFKESLGCELSFKPTILL